MTTGQLPLPDLPGLADVSPLGRGGFADVLLGRQIHLERWVAAKVFRVTLTDPVAADRFRTECRTLGRLDQYPHVITVYDAGVLPDGRPFLIVERCDGSLADLVEVRGTLPVDRAVEIALTTARALLFAHSCGVLHGDVTPRNILLRASGAAVLADFGLAVLREHRGAPAAGYTADHAAPEAVTGDVVDEAGDVFGLGSTLATMLSGHPPFPTGPGGEAGRLATVAAGPPAPAAHVPSWLGMLVARMVAADPARRPSTDEVVATLAAGGTVATTGPSARAPGAHVPDGWSAAVADDDRTPPMGLPAGGASTRLRGLVPEQRTAGVSAQIPAAGRFRGLGPWLVVAAAAALGGVGGAVWWAAAAGGGSPAPAPPVSAPATPGPSTAARPSPTLAGPVRPTVVVDPQSGTDEQPVAVPRRATPRTVEPAAPVAPAPAPVVPQVSSRAPDIPGGGGQNNGDNGDGGNDFFGGTNNGDGNNGGDGNSGFPFTN